MANVDKYKNIEQARSYILEIARMDDTIASLYDRIETIKGSLNALTTEEKTAALANTGLTVSDIAAKITTLENKLAP